MATTTLIDRNNLLNSLRKDMELYLNDETSQNWVSRLKCHEWFKKIYQIKDYYSSHSKEDCQLSRTDKKNIYMAYNCLDNVWTMNIRGASLKQQIIPLLMAALRSLENISHLY